MCNLANHRQLIPPLFLLFFFPHLAFSCSGGGSASIMSAAVDGEVFEHSPVSLYCVCCLGAESSLCHVHLWRNDRGVNIEKQN